MNMYTFLQITAIYSNLHNFVTLNIKIVILRQAHLNNASSGCSFNEIEMNLHTFIYIYTYVLMYNNSKTYFIEISCQRSHVNNTRMDKLILYFGRDVYNL